MTDFDDEDYDIYEITMDELEDLPYHDYVGPGVSQYNVGSEAQAMEVLNLNYDSRVQIYIHDSASDTMYPVMTNAGHGEGMSASYLLEIIEGDNATLAEELEALAPPGVIHGEIDWYQINVLE